MRHLNFAVLFVALAFTGARADNWSKTYEVGPSPQLRVDTTDADIRLDTWDQNKIEATVTTERDKIGDDGVRVIEHQTGNVVEIEVRLRSHHININWGQHRVTVDIHMPRQGKVNLHTGDGHISVNHLKGDMEFSSGDGRIEVEDGDGHIRAHTGDGSVRAVGRFDAVDLTTGDGRVSLRANAGSHIENSWQVRTSDGSVDLEIPANLAADVDLHTGDGHISLNLPVTVEGRLDRQDIHGKLNGGGNRLTVHTGDGSITVDKS